jgi:proline iminopeptidase
MKVGKQKNTLMLAAILAVSGLFAGHPTLQDVWARHDQIVMRGPGRAVNLDSTQSHTFKGKLGRTVRGWDVGGADLPAVLWWNGGPGFSADPAWDVNCFEDASAYRHLEIDSPGTGMSSWVPGWKPEDTVDDAAAFLRLRGIDTPVLVTGYSWGSTMALLFAQRHPEMVRGVVIGGVWANTPQEVSAFLGESGNRRWMPGLQDVFRKVVPGRLTATGLHRAIRDGRGGKPLCQAFGDAELFQASEGRIPRGPLSSELPLVHMKPVDMFIEKDEDVRSAFIESEMMSRGEHGEWALKIRFAKRLSEVPIIVLQGRFDQVCSREIAMKVFNAWPCQSKLLVPMNGGHWGYGGPDKGTFAAAGLALTEVQEASAKKAMALHFGSHRALIGAAIDCLARTKPAHR